MAADWGCRGSVPLRVSSARSCADTEASWDSPEGCLDHQTNLLVPWPDGKAHSPAAASQGPPSKYRTSKGGRRNRPCENVTVRSTGNVSLLGSASATTELQRSTPLPRALGEHCVSDIRVQRWGVPPSTAVADASSVHLQAAGVSQQHQQYQSNREKQHEPNLQVVVRLRKSCGSTSPTSTEPPRGLSIARFGLSSGASSEVDWDPSVEGQVQVIRSYATLHCPTPVPTPDPMPMAPFPCRGPRAPPSRVFA